MTTAAQIRASAKYNKANRKFFALSLSKKYDMDIIEHLEALDETTNGYIKRLIREDMKNR